ncbi:MAG: pyridoxal phosphate-dependent aminotransferase [Rhodanobacteraceae bacterium]|nr:pyridoxal phosphate-dependent aminotransferase [Rhodanobacteraceae bacterium]
MSVLPDFRLESYFSRWEFNARHHMTASDAQTVQLTELLALAGDAERERWEQLSLGYSETWGSEPLRAAIAAGYDGLDAADILTFAGAEEGIYCALRVLLDKSHHAIVSVPNYQSMETLALDCAGSVSGLALQASNGWQPDIDEFKALLQPNTRVVALNFPNNPTGVIARSDTFAAIAAICAERNIYLFSDEVYRGLERDDALRLPPAAAICATGLSLGVMSKAYGLPGLRIGWIACRDRALLARMERYKHYLSICNAKPSEVLATIALKAAETLLARNRARCRANLARLGAFFAAYSEQYEWCEPDGGCVGFARYSGADGVETHCRRLVEEAGVLLLPASLFESALLPVATDRFRVGFGRDGIEAGLAAWEGFLTR